MPVVRFESEYVRLGGAANVAHNIAALGGRAGARRHRRHRRCGERAAGAAAAAGVDPDGLVEDRLRPTTEKVRIVTDRNQQVARIDYEGDTDAGGAIEAEIVARIEALGARREGAARIGLSEGTATRAVVEALVAVSARRGRGPRTPPCP